MMVGVGRAGDRRRDRDHGGADPDAIRQRRPADGAGREVIDAINRRWQGKERDAGSSPA